MEFVTVAPFECAWRKDLKFREAGRGCVAFEAFAQNDVTLVFRENVGSQHYHYKRDNSPHYTVILCSHRNKRLRIEVDGKTVIDVEVVGLCSLSFQNYWISIYDGLISVGKGRYPFQNAVFQWLDENPNCSVRYVGLSSWDKHVGYRKVSVLPVLQNHLSLWKHVDCGGDFVCDEFGDEDLEDELSGSEKCGLENFLVSWELSDVSFVVGVDEKPVPAHKAILALAGNFPLSWSECVLELDGVSYPVLRELLEYIYTGRTQVVESDLASLLVLTLKFEVLSLVKQCEEAIEHYQGE